jgi:opacity protein-like surface antigen
MRLLSKKNAFALTLAALPLCASHGGEAPVQLWEATPAVQPMVPRVSIYGGEGFYWGLQGGINAYQSYEGTKRGTVNGTKVTLEMREKVGGYGGVKWGYAFSNGGGFLSAFEADVFYNGADYDVDARTDHEKLGSVTGRFDTGAVMGNYILRFGQGQFQPYIGAGIGGWFGQISDTRVSIDGVGSLRVGSGDTNGGFAWQLLAGFDYYFSERMSLFTEYKFLNYHGIDLPTSDPVRQHLVGVGLRVHY